MATIAPHQARHIQNYSDAASLEPHWGYVSRVIPCTNDAGSCAYLDLVYAAHDRSMLYSGIIWLTVLAILLSMALIARTNLSTDPLRVDDGRSTLVRLPRAFKSSIRKRLLPGAWRPIFGPASRLQVVTLFILLGYLTIWTFAGLTYQKWITPVKNKPGVYNTRTTLGPWADRVGVLAYALTPLSVLLGSRESLLSVLTGIPYQKFNFLHRWLGYIIFLQSSLHTIGWCVVELRLYQPQPSVGREWIVQTYMIWGLVAMTLLTLLVASSTPWGIRLTGYEFFRKAHYVLAMVYIGACWGHWEQLKCFLLPSLLLWCADRGTRIIRTVLLHYRVIRTGSLGFETATAAITRYRNLQGGDVLRLDLEMDQDPWHIGQHYYLCFPECSIWQSHPFTPLNVPRTVDGRVKHSYILRAKQGETKKLAELAAKHATGNSLLTTSVILTGAYGERIMDRVAPDVNIVCIAGGTGITYILPVLLQLASQCWQTPDRQIEMIWSVRHADDLEWISQELDVLRKCSQALRLNIRLYATRDCRCDIECCCGEKISNEKQPHIEIDGASASSDSIAGPPAACTSAKKVADAAMNIGRPDIEVLLQTFVETTSSARTIVLASGPAGMLADTRQAVARCNDGLKVWRGQARFDVDLICDDRLEW